MKNLLPGKALLFLIFLATSISFTSTARSSSRPKYADGTYIPGTLIVKIKPEYRDRCSNKAVLLKPLNDGLASISASSISKKFLHSKPPAEARNKKGEKLVDLSLIYLVEFSPVIKVEEAVEIMKSTGVLEYAEPLFVRKINFTPNDPSVPSQYALNKINAFMAWDVWTGDTNVVIGIIDTGTDWDHPDLAGNIKYNYSDPIDGIDNDNDGFTDNFRGWDVSENDNDPMVAAQNHGSHVSGCAAAVTNNSIGVASPGYKCKFLPVKSAFDASGSTIDNGYDGITYAADHGANVINCSFGGGNYSQMEQDVVNYATINCDALVVASAGNSGIEENQFPGSYENVISVASTGTSDGKSNFSTYGSAVDVCAPGTNILSTVYDDSYTTMSGTSMSSPIAAGCAAMIKSRFPALNARQVGEQLRTTCDNIYSSGGNTAFIGKLGKGRVNLWRAMTDSISPGVIVKDNTLTDGNDNAFIIGDTVSVLTLFENLLRPTANFTCTLSTTNNTVQILQANYNGGVIASQDTASNFSSVYRVYIRPTAPVNSTVLFKLTMNDGTWSDIFTFSMVVNVDYINITENNIATSMTSKSLLGYNQTGQQEGLGFSYKGSASMLYDMGLMIGEQSHQVSDNLRAVSANDEDFTAFSRVTAVDPGIISDFDVNGSFIDNGTTSTAPLDILVTQHGYAWASPPDDNYVMVTYNIKNLGTGTLSNVYAGICADWDVPAFANNKCSTDMLRRMGYIWSTDSGGLWGGIKLLSHTGSFTHYAIDNIAGAAGILMTDGFSDAEKFTSLSTMRTDAGTGSATGNDVISVVSTGSFSLSPGDSVDVAFALVGGEDLAAIQVAADAAQLKYDATFIGIEPIAAAAGNQLSQSYPNPADRELRIDFSLVKNNFTQLHIYNMIGEKVKSLVEQDLSSGKYSLIVDVSSLPAGNYFYRIQSGAYSATRTLTVIHR